MDRETTTTTWKTSLRRRLLAWFGKHARDLPWRRTRDPYAVWVSEIMLQQTQVVTVIPYFERFMAAFPTIESLARADEQQVLRLWEGLGYYRRARQLHQAARVVVDRHGGEFPLEVDEVRALPGIGRYTAGAILSISQDARQPILEANTIRVFSRLLAYRDDPRSTAGQATLWRFAEEILPRKRAGEFNQSLMELGSEVCTPREPACDCCPVRVQCPTFAEGLQSEIPLAARKTRYESVREGCLVVRRGKKVLLGQCQPGERWAGMWDFPRFQVSKRTRQAIGAELVARLSGDYGLIVDLGSHLTTIKHGVTRFRITLNCYEATHRSGRTRDRHLRWVEPKELDNYPLSVTGRKISQVIGA